MQEEEKLMNNYLIWKTNKINNKAPFFPVYKEFKEVMQTLSTGSISLFLFFGLNSKNKTGESFYSIESIATFFNKSPRTISNWIKELEDQNLIIRKQSKKNSVSITFLKPY